jgi:putative copper export protein
MFNITFEEVIEFVCLVMFELFTSFTAVFLLMIGSLVLIFNTFWGVILIIIGILFVLLFIVGIVGYVKCKEIK